jgi:hypothetical protein
MILTVRGTGNSTSTPTAAGGTQKRTKASALVRPNKRPKTITSDLNIESGSDEDQDFTIDDGEEARGANSGNDTEEEGGYEQMREDADRDHKVLFFWPHFVYSKSYLTPPGHSAQLQPYQ